MPGNQPQTVPHHWLPNPVSHPFTSLVAQASLPSRSHHWLPKPAFQAVPHAGCPSQFLKPFHMLVAQASLPSRSHHWLPKPVSQTVPITGCPSQSPIPFTSLVAQASIPSVHITGCPSQSLSYKLNHYSRNGIESRNEMYRKARNMGTIHFTNSSCHMCERIQVEKDPIRISMMHALFT